MATRITKDELHEMEKGADSVTSLNSPFGTYDAIVRTGDKTFRVITESLNPIGDVKVEEITDEQADALITDTSDKVYGRY